MKTGVRKSFAKLVRETAGMGTDFSSPGEMDWAIWWLETALGIFEEAGRHGHAIADPNFDEDVNLTQDTLDVLKARKNLQDVTTQLSGGGEHDWQSHPDWQEAAEAVQHAEEALWSNHSMSAEKAYDYLNNSWVARQFDNP